MLIAFENERQIASGDLSHVALEIKKRIDAGRHGQILAFDTDTSETIEIDVRGTARQVLARYPETSSPGESAEKRGPGRPKLGVVGREVTLLPRHWEWLDDQPGGASVALRKLVEEARRSSQPRDHVRKAQEAVYRFMSAMTGDLPGFEEALRAFYANEFGRFRNLIEGWPKDVAQHLKHLVSKTEQSVGALQAAQSLLEKQTAHAPASRPIREPSPASSRVGE